MCASANSVFWLWVSCIYYMKFIFFKHKKSRSRSATIYCKLNVIRICKIFFYFWQLNKCPISLTYTKVATSYNKQEAKVPGVTGSWTRKNIYIVLKFLSTISQKNYAHYHTLHLACRWDNYSNALVLENITITVTNA